MGQITSFESLETRRLFNGFLDPSFAQEGAVIISAIPNFEAGIALATMPDSRIVIAWQEGSGAQARVHVTRLNADGHIDSNFGGIAAGYPDGTPAGQAIIPNQRAMFNVADIAVLSSGKVLLGGSSIGPQQDEDDTGRDFAVVQLRQNGAMDSSFGGTANGYAGTPAGAAWVNFYITGEPTFTGPKDDGLYLDVGLGGRIILGGAVDHVRGYGLAVFQTNGVLDAAFDDDGVLVNPGHEGSGQTERITIRGLRWDNDGSLIVAFKSEENRTFVNGIASERLVRYTNGGVFFASATIEEGTPLQTPFLSSIVRAADGNTLALFHNDQAHMSPYKLKYSFERDPDFGIGGRGSTVPATSHHSKSQARTLADGRTLTISQRIDSRYLNRFNTDGSIDPTLPRVLVGKFGAYDMDVDAIDRAVVATAFSSDGAIVVRRYLGGGTFQVTSSGTLIVAGSSFDDAINVRVRRTDGRLIARVGDAVRSFTASAVKRISVYGHGGNDSIVIESGLRGVFVDAGAGRDTITGGDGGDTLLGNTGNDTIDARAGNDNVSGGGGNDYLLGGTGNDTLAGNGGSDTLTGAAGNDQLFGGPGTADLINGGAGNDTAAADVLDRYRDVEVLE